MSIFQDSNHNYTDEEKTESLAESFLEVHNKAQNLRSIRDDIEQQAF